MNAGPYRGGKIHVLAELCDTCIFRPGNLMDLQAGRVKQMVRDARRSDTAIICHSTLYRDDIGQAVCRGFHDRYSTNPLRIAARLRALVEDPVPTTHERG